MVFKKSISKRNEKKKTVIKANKPIYLGFAILSLSKIRMCEYWYDNMKPKYTSNYTCERPLPMGKNKKKIGLMKDELGGKIMKEFIGL